MTNNAAGNYVAQGRQSSGGGTLALNANWTNAAVTLTNTDNLQTLQTTNTGYCNGTYWYPYYTPYWGDRRPIRLTMAEVERLRVGERQHRDRIVQRQGWVLVVRSVFAVFPVAVQQEGAAAPLGP